MHARVVVLAGPSGAGKSHLASRLGLPVLRLDDYYKNGDDPTLPIDLAGGDPIADWDDPASWDAERAVAALAELCRTGRTNTPRYDIATSRAIGHRVLELGDAAYFLAEGIFAHEIVAACRDLDLLADALCVTQPRAVTFLRRLVRDLRERRKPPLVLLRRGLHLFGEHHALVERAEALGCRVVSPEAAFRQVRALAGFPG